MSKLKILFGNLLGKNEMGIKFESKDSSLSLLLKNESPLGPFHWVILDDDALNELKDFLERIKWQK